jgi:hypothetical protein
VTDSFRNHSFGGIFNVAILHPRGLQRKPGDGRFKNSRRAADYVSEMKKFFDWLLRL